VVYSAVLRIDIRSAIYRGPFDMISVLTSSVGISKSAILCVSVCVYVRVCVCECVCECVYVCVVCIITIYNKNTLITSNSINNILYNNNKY